MVPEELHFTREHEWVSLAGSIATMGISAYAQQQLGDVTFVELPEVGKVVARIEALGSVESVKAASDYFAPLSGTVIEVNTKLEEHPELVNQDPYELGWICKLEAKDVAELSSLMDSSHYQEYLEGLGQ